MFLDLPYIVSVQENDTDVVGELHYLIHCENTSYIVYTYFVDSFLFELEASDRDILSNSALSFYLITAYPAFTFNYFDFVYAPNKSNSTQRCIGINQVIDREITGDIIFLTIAVRDGGSPSLSSLINITFYIEEVNDEKPFFSSESLTNFMIREDIPNYHIMTQYVANDPDKFPILVYTIEPMGIPFAIHPDNGTLFVLSGLDYEKTQNYTFLVVVQDMGSETGEQRDFLIIRVDVLDANDNCPNITNLPLSSPIEVT